MSTEIAVRYSKILKAFAGIGVVNGTARPPSDSNTFHMIWEYYVASRLESVARKRATLAKEACMSAGLLGDRDALVTGMLTTVYQGPYMNVTAKKSNAAEGLDRVLLNNELTKRYGADVAKTIIAKAIKPRAPAVLYDFVTGEDD